MSNQASNTFERLLKEISEKLTDYTPPVAVPARKSYEMAGLGPSKGNQLAGENRWPARYIDGKPIVIVEELIEHHDVSVEGLLREHEIHQETLQRAKHALKELGARAVLRYRPEPLPEDSDAWDLIVTLGGDGTLLWASHLADSSTPMLAINSAPDTSVGYFCAGDAHNVDQVLAASLDGSLKSTRLSRMRVEVGDKLVSTRVLNDALYCHESPAATSRYILEVGGEQERQADRIATGWRDDVPYRRRL